MDEITAASNMGLLLKMKELMKFGDLQIRNDVEYEAYLVRVVRDGETVATGSGDTLEIAVVLAHDEVFDND